MFDGITEVKSFIKVNFSTISIPELEAKRLFLEKEGWSFASPTEVFENTRKYINEAIGSNMCLHSEGYLVLSIWQEQLVNFWNILKTNFNLYLERANLPQSTAFIDSGILKGNENIFARPTFIQASNEAITFMWHTFNFGIEDLEQGHYAWNILKEYTVKYIEVLDKSFHKFLFYNAFLPYFNLAEPIDKLTLTESQKDYIRCSKYNHFKKIKLNETINPELLKEVALITKLKDDLLRTNSVSEKQFLAIEFSKIIRTTEVEEYFPKFLENHGIHCTWGNNGDLVFRNKDEELSEMSLEFGKMDISDSSYEHESIAL